MAQSHAPAYRHFVFLCVAIRVRRALSPLVVPVAPSHYNADARLPQQDPAGDRRSPAMDAGWELFGIFSSLLLLYSWCSCSGMSRL